MRLYCWRGATRNFGDELNTLLWPRLLPAFFDDDPAALFLGIGSVLDTRHAQDAVKLVAGAGYGGYQPLPELDARWVVHWVRGPRTARLLGLPEGLGLGDPAMLLPDSRTGNDQTIGFMPHFESLAFGAWTAATEAAGILLIDPRDDPATIIAAIGRCRLLLSEAMHGAIVADAMRVPWIALRPLASVHRLKWHDWAEALEVDVRFQALAASSLLERLNVSALGVTARRRRLWQSAAPALRVVAQRRFAEQAVASLERATKAEPQLSHALALDRCRCRMLERLEALRRDPLRPV